MAGWLMAQISDIHFGAQFARVFADDILRWWNMMLEDWDKLPQPVELAVVTGDVTITGDRDALTQVKEVFDRAPAPIHPIPGVADVEHEGGKENWVELFGETERIVEHRDVRFLFLDLIGKSEANELCWILTTDQVAWLRKQVQADTRAPLIAVIYPALEKREGFYTPPWDSNSADQMLQALAHGNLLAILTGERHANGEWLVGNAYVISTGGLCGYRWTNVPPDYCILTRPGYRLIWLEDGTLRTFWREITSPVQVTISFVGESHTLGPRPQVHVLDIYADCDILVQAYARDADIESVEIGLGGSPWIPLQKTWEGPWSEWEGTLHTYEVGWGQQLLVARARSTNGDEAYDAVPFWMRSVSARRASAVREAIIFELMERPR